MEAGTPSLRQQGMQALQDGNLDKAIDLLARAVMADDKDTDAKALLGITYSQKGLHAQAKRALETAVSMEPNNANYRFNLGVVLERAGEMAGAAVAYRDTLQVSPQHAQAKAKLQAMGPQVHQLLASAPKLNVPPPGGPGPGDAGTHVAQAPPPMAPPPMAHGAPPMGGAPIGAAPTGGPMGAPPMAPPPMAPPMGMSSPTMGMPAAGGPPGTVQCQYCYKYAKLGMVCEFCSQPLPPPPKPVAMPSPMGGPMGPPMGGPAGAVPMYHRSFSAPHRGGLILTLGILSLLVCTPLGIPAWVMGNKDLGEMDAGVMDDSGRGLTQAGRVCGIIGSVFMILGLIYLVFIIVMLASGASRGALR